MNLIELRLHKGKLVPIFFCERCHKPIQSVEEAMLCNEPGQDECMVCHKITCDPGWRGRLELRDILAQLVNNYMGVDVHITPEGFSNVEVKPLRGFQTFVRKAP